MILSKDEERVENYLAASFMHVLRDVRIAEVTVNGCTEDVIRGGRFKVAVSI